MHSRPRAPLTSSMTPIPRGITGDGTFCTPPKPLPSVEHSSSVACQTLLLRDTALIQHRLPYALCFLRRTWMFFVLNNDRLLVPLAFNGLFRWWWRQVLNPINLTIHCMVVLSWRNMVYHRSFLFFLFQMVLHSSSPQSELCSTAMMFPRG